MNVSNFDKWRYEIPKDQLTQTGTTAANNDDNYHDY